MRKFVLLAATLGAVALAGCGSGASGQAPPSASMPQEGAPQNGVVEGASRTPAPPAVDSVADTTCAHYHAMRTRSEQQAVVAAWRDAHPYPGSSYAGYDRLDAEGQLQHIEIAFNTYCRKDENADARLFDFQDIP